MEADVRFYEENGYWVSPEGVLDQGLLDRAAEGLRRYHAGERDWRLPLETGFSDWKPGHGDGVRNNEYVTLQSRALRELALSAAVGRMAAALARSSEIRLFDDQAVYKPPQTGRDPAAIGWHVDGDYWRTCASPAMLTAWIPFHDCPEEMGPLVVVPGSHRWPADGRARKLSFHSQNMEIADEVWDRLVERRAMTLKRGQVSFHHRSTLHASYPNRGTGPRIALAVHLQDHRNHYQAAIHPDGRPVVLFNDRICRKSANGEPDYKDDGVFPVLWRADDEGA